MTAVERLWGRGREGCRPTSWRCASIHSQAVGPPHLATKLLPQPQLDAALGFALITKALRIRSDSKSTVAGRSTVQRGAACRRMGTELPGACTLRTCAGQGPQQACATPGRHMLAPIDQGHGCSLPTAHQPGSAGHAANTAGPWQAQAAAFQQLDLTRGAFQELQ